MRFPSTPPVPAGFGRQDIPTLHTQKPRGVVGGTPRAAGPELDPTALEAENGELGHRSAHTQSPLLQARDVKQMLGSVSSDEPLGIVGVGVVLSTGPQLLR